MTLLRHFTACRPCRTVAPTALKLYPVKIGSLSTRTPAQLTIEKAEETKDLINVSEKQSLYTADIDQAFSLFSPTPTGPVNRSEGDFVSAAVLSGAPAELQAREVRIYRSTKPATQSGNWYGHHWRMDWDILPKGHRWENPLMGWQSSADFMQGTHLAFNSKEDAIKYAEKHGYEYYVQEPNCRKIIPKAYANNFLWTNKKLKHIRTK